MMKSKLWDVPEKFKALLLVASCWVNHGFSQPMRGGDL